MYTQKLNVLLIFMALAMVACDATQPGYESYDNPNKKEQSSERTSASTSTSEKASTDTGSCPEKAANFFAAKIQPAIEGACSTCHSRAGHPLPLIAAQPDNNRVALRDWANGDGAKISNFIKSNPPHPGGDQSNVLPQGIPEYWIGLEVECGN